MYQQRAAPSGRDRQAPSRRWLSQTPLLGDATDMDRYVVVDDIDDDLVVLVVAPWPDQDPDGRLTFGDPARRDTWSMPATRFHDRVTAARLATQQEAPDRPLRIGDTFLVRMDDAEPDAGFTLVRDVTREAREQAKLAYFAAVTPRLDPADAQDMQLLATDGADRDGAPPGVGPSASPAV